MNNDSPQQPQQAPQTGPEAILHALRNIDLDALEKQAQEDIKSGKRTRRPKAVSLMNIIAGLRKNGLRPEDYMLRAVPVIPTKYRPFSAAGSTLIPGDANVLYQELMGIRDAHDEERQLLGDESAGQSRLALYDAVRAVYGFGDPVKAKTRQKDVKGFLGKLTGSTSKYSYLHRKMLSKTVDNTGRSTIIVDPELGMDEFGLPVDMAYTMCAPYIQRKLKLKGMKDADALKAVRDKTPESRRALEEVLAERPLVYSRAPTWFMHGVLAGKAKLIDGDAIAISPLVTSGMGADFDGDDCISMVYVVLNNSYFCKNNQELCCMSQEELAKLRTCRIDKDMFARLNIPVINSEEELFLVDLEEFPHGEFSNTVQGANGPINFYRTLPGTKVLSFDEPTHMPKWKDVAFWSEHPGRKVEIVTLEQGRQLFTDNDPRAVYGISKRALNLTPDRFTPSAALEAEVFVPVSNRCDISRVDGVEFKQFISLLGENSKEQVLLDFDFGYLLGALCGDGWWDKKDLYNGRYKNEYKRVYLADSEGWVAQAVHAVLQSVLDCLVNVGKMEFFAWERGRYGATTRYAFSTSSESNCFTRFVGMLTTWLGGHGDVTTAGSGNKHLPSFFIQTPREFREGLLCGLVDTDGACSVSQGKNTPQLMVSFCSTSLRLCREVRLLAMSLGIRASISFSRHTTRGNEAWIVTLSTTDMKKHNVLARLKNERKRDVFINTKVSADATHKKEDKVVFPDYIASVIRHACYSPKVIDSEEKKEAMDVYYSVTDANKSGSVSRSAIRKILHWINKDISEKNKIIAAAVDYLKSDTEECTPDTIDVIRKAIRAVYPPGHALYSEGKTAYARTNRPLKEGRLSASKKKTMLAWFDGKTAYNPVFTNEEIAYWVSNFVNNEGVSWIKVVAVEKTGKEETGYDLTVPGYETFMSAEGVILSNTINVHVPASDAAVKDAREKMMPSVTPFANREEGKIVPLPKQEQILGLYAANMRKPLATHSFSSEQEALEAIRKGQVPLRDEVVIAPPGSQVKTAGSVQDPPAENVKGQSPEEGDAEEGGPVRDPRTGKWLPTERLKGVHRKKGETGHGGAGQLE